jgi:hypothetical protein
MRTAVWKAALAGVVLFILGVAAGAATIDMLEGEDAAPTVADAVTVTSVETRTEQTATETVTVEEPSEVGRPGWSTCANARRGYSIDYPSGWYTTHLRPAQACEYFHPEPFEIVEGTEFPPTGLFVFLTDQTVDSYVQEATNPMFFETVRREDTTVGERSAVLIETTATGQGESEPGERTYGYVVAVGPEEDAFVVLATGLPGDERYDEFKDVADEAVKTAQFLER